MASPHSLVPLRLPQLNVLPLVRERVSVPRHNLHRVKSAREGQSAELRHGSFVRFPIMRLVSIFERFLLRGQ